MAYYTIHFLQLEFWIPPFFNKEICSERDVAVCPCWKLCGASDCKHWQCRFHFKV